MNYSGSLDFSFLNNMSSSDVEIVNTVVSTTESRLWTQTAGFQL